MKSRDEIAVFTDQIESSLTHARHNAHIYDDVGRIGEFHTELRDARAQWSHRERHNVHRAATHRASEQALKVLAHLNWVGPVVRRAGIFFIE